MSASPTRQDWITDGALIALALLIALPQIFAPAGADGDGDSPRRFGAADVRELEQSAMVFDAGRQYPAATRDLIGLEGAEADTPAAVAREALDAVEAIPWATQMRFTAAAIAVALDEHELARAELRALEGRDAPPLEPEWALPVGALDAQASGVPVDIDAIGAKLRAIGASRWLVARVEARHHDNLGAADAAARARDEAAQLATSYVGTVMAVGATELLLLLLGLAALIAARAARRALARRGFAGIPTGAPSPFDPGRTRRVLLGWFVGHGLIAVVLGAIAHALDASPPGLAFAETLQVFAHGVLAVVLIQRARREPGDAPPLARLLDLRLTPLPGRHLGLAGWSLPGLGVVTVCAAGGALLSLFIFGPPDVHQPTIERLIRDASWQTFAFTAISAVLLAPVIEEILFRGFLFRNLREAHGPMIAAALSGVCFGAVHLDPERLLPLSALGFGLALLYEWSGSLLVCVSVHAAWNLLNLVGVWAIYQAV